MQAQNIEIQNCDGSHQRWACVGEIDRMMNSGEIYRISRRKERVQRYRCKEYPKPSASHDSPAHITTADGRALAGLLRVDEVWVERLIGLNLLAEGTPTPTYGYL